MYRANRQHLQSNLFSDLDNLSAKARRRLEESWAGVFYREFFCRLDEAPFAVLYSDTASRPNVPINVLVGLETLKAGFGWSDEEMYEACLYNVQVRYALGMRNLGEGEFDLRTVYNFRQRLSEHMQRTGENLLDRAFIHITDAQIGAFQIKTGRLRMDSTQIATNIRRTSRLQLLVEVLQRVHRILDEADRARYATAFAPYLQGSSGQYVYRLKGEEEIRPRLQCVGELMYRLVVELAPTYETHDTYQMLRRVFHEHFILSADASPSAKADDDTGSDPSGGQPVGSETIPLSEADDPPTPLKSEAPTSITVGLTDAEQLPPAALATVHVRPNKDISSTSLQSPDDWRASYRCKRNQGYRGYVVNLAETCEPVNPFQLILNLQTAPNVTDDPVLLAEALPDLKVRTDLYALYTDGGFGSPAVDAILAELHIKHVPTALRGRTPTSERTLLADCTFQMDADGQPVGLKCPHGYRATIRPGRKPGRYIAEWETTPCPICHFAPHHIGRKPPFMLCAWFSRDDFNRAIRRQRTHDYRVNHKNLRVAIEATIAALKRPFNDDQVPVRGQFRLSALMIGSAAMVNIRRIQRYLAAKCHSGKPEPATGPCADSNTTEVKLPTLSLLSSAWARLRRWLWPNQGRRPALALTF
jgi:hypothetical protein